MSYVTYILAYYCMPTLLGLKPSSLVNVIKSKKDYTADFKDRLTNELRSFACHYQEFYENEDALLVLIYNREQLYNILSKNENKMFLCKLGYPCDGGEVELMLQELRERYQSYRSKIKSSSITSSLEFPHEIGVLLGYPLRDVIDFIHYRGESYLLSGCWKVYHNVNQAMNTFECFRRVREEAINFISEGRALLDMKELWLGPANYN